MDKKKISGKIIILLVGASILASCKSGKEQNMETPSKEIIAQLEAVKGKGILFGHQDDLAYGVDWYYPNGESDVKRVSGDFPAIFGWELGGLELGNTHNLDSVPFALMKQLAIEADKMGGINTFSWHAFSAIDSVSSWDTETKVVEHILPGGRYHKEFMVHLEKVAQFFLSLKREDGQQTPFIFRPWHEMDGSWFWWGDKHCTKEEYKKLFRLTIEFLRGKGLTQMVVAYSPDNKYNSVNEYLKYYPGDSLVDILGADNYHDFSIPGGEEKVVSKLHLAIEAAKTKNKLAAFTETGLEFVADSTWYTKKLGKVLSDPLVSKEISYVMVWRNDPKVHYYFPYPGHPAAGDAANMLANPGILLLNKFKEAKREASGETI